MVDRGARFRAAVKSTSGTGVTLAAGTRLRQHGGGHESNPEGDPEGYLEVT